jgi:hypothetical protein
MTAPFSLLNSTSSKKERKSVAKIIKAHQSAANKDQKRWEKEKKKSLKNKRALEQVNQADFFQLFREWKKHESKKRTSDISRIEHAKTAMADFWGEPTLLIEKITCKALYQFVGHLNERRCYPKGALASLNIYSAVLKYAQKKYKVEGELEQLILIKRMIDRYRVNL